jgi:hypothetical protein
MKDELSHSQPESREEPQEEKLGGIVSLPGGKEEIRIESRDLS